MAFNAKRLTSPPARALSRAEYQEPKRQQLHARTRRVDRDDDPGGNWYVIVERPDGSAFVIATGLTRAGALAKARLLRPHLEGVRGVRVERSRSIGG